MWERYAAAHERLRELAAAGTDTTAQLIANAVVFLSEHPDQLAEAIADPSLWEAVVEETPDDHLAFGKGRHFCLGAPIGRAEARIGLRVLFERLPDLRTVTPLPLDFAPIAILPMRQTLPVRWDEG